MESHFSAWTTSRGLRLNLYAADTACLMIDADGVSTTFHFDMADLRKLAEMAEVAAERIEANKPAEAHS